MSTPFYSDEEYQKARKRVRAKKGFYWHLASYAITISFLFGINILTDPNELWFLYPALAWGVSILFHFIGVFGIPGLNFNDKNWEEKEIEKELRKIAPPENAPTLPDEELELKEFKKLREDWDDADFV